MISKKVLKRIEQICVEDAQSRTHILEFVTQDIMKTTGMYNLIKKAEIAIDIYRAGDYYESKNQRLAEIQHVETIDIVLEMCIAVMPHHKPTSIHNIASSLANMFEYHDVFDGVKTASELLGVCQDVGLYWIWIDPIMIQSRFNLEAETWEKIEATKYMDPLITEPDTWINNTDGGYLSVCKHVVLGKNNRHEEKQALDALNILQSIEWELDPETLAVPEYATKPLDTHKKREAHNLMVRNSRKAYNRIIDAGNKFNYEWRYCFRGRAYNSGYYITLQGTDYKKASAHFTHKQIIRLEK